MTGSFRSDFTVGLEEEILLVDAESHQLAPVAADVLDRMAAGGTPAAGHEAYAAQIELRSQPCRSVEAAVSELGRLRAAGRDAGATLMATGVHPTGRLGDAPLVRTERYDRVAGEMRGLLERTPESALHVHVGLPDERAAIAAFNALRLQLPLLLGLSANSPWWFARDSGLASARSLLVRSYPGRGIPEALESLEELERRTTALLVAADAPEPTFVWWDLRLHPVYGTLEIRELDTQSSLESVAALAALVRALVLRAVEEPAPEPVRSEVLSWSSFRAARNGVAAEILDRDALRPLADVAARTVEAVRPWARAAGDEDALGLVLGVLERGGGARRQRQSYARGGVAELLRVLVADTASAPVGGAARR
jgi:carboxylate-amine ligase